MIMCARRANCTASQDTLSLIASLCRQPQRPTASGFVLWPVADLSGSPLLPRKLAIKAHSNPRISLL
jgi:hypothetical protein